MTNALDCIFCKIANGQIPAKIITQTRHSIAFLDAFPLSKGHSLVIPKNHYHKIQDMPVEETTDLFETMRNVTAKVDKITNATLLAIHNGKESGQEIPHVHVHIIPRSSTDGAGPVHSMFGSSLKLSEDELSILLNQLKF